MVLGTDIAVIVRGRRGRNLLLAANGIDLKLVAQASQEAANALETKSSLPAEPFGGGAGQALLCGYVRVLGGGYTAVYRLVNQVFVIALASASSNIFTSLNLVASVTKLLVVECKTPDITPDKVEKRYAPIYFSIDALVSRGTFEVGRALLDCITVLEALAPESGKAKRMKVRDLPQPPAQGPRSKRKLSTQAEQLAELGFAPPVEVTSIAVELPEYSMPAIEEPLFGQGEDPFAASDKVGPGGANENDPFAASEQQAEKGDGDWAAFGGEKDPFAEDGDPFGPPSANSDMDSDLQAAAAQRQQLASASRLALRAGPPLVLRETWLSEVVGQRVARARLVGGVYWRSADVRTFSGSIPFQLMAPSFPDAQVRQALQCCQRHEKAARDSSVANAFVAESISPASASVPVLRYTLPPSFCSPPLLAQLSRALLPAGARRGAKAELAAVVGVDVAVTPQIGLHPSSLVVELLVPATLGEPVRVTPASAQWSRQQRTLRWRLTAVAEQREALVALFRVQAAAGREAAAAALGLVTATATLTSEPGETFTGTSLLQASTPMADMHFSPSATEWTAQVLMKFL